MREEGVRDGIRCEVVEEGCYGVFGVLRGSGGGAGFGIFGVRSGGRGDFSVG